MRELSCGMKSPRDCFDCQMPDCCCNDNRTAEEGVWMRDAWRKHSKREAPKRVTIPVNHDTTKRPVKSSRRFMNFEKLLF